MLIISTSLSLTLTAGDSCDMSCVWLHCQVDQVFKLTVVRYGSRLWQFLDMIACTVNSWRYVSRHGETEDIGLHSDSFTIIVKS